MIVTDKKIESAHLTSVCCKKGLMICEILLLGTQEVSIVRIIEKTYELFVGANETVLYTRVSVEQDSTVP